MEYPLPEHILEKVEFPHSLIMKRNDGIIEIRCGENVNYTVEQIQENHEVIKRMAAGTPALILNITSSYTLITSEARNYVAEGHHKDFIAAEAFLISSLPQRMLARFYVTIVKPPVPTKYFNIDEKAEAESWLNQNKK